MISLRLVTVRHDGRAGTVMSLGPGTIVCGRLRGDVLFPDDATVSPEHVRFMIWGDGAVVEDLGTLNGTFIRIRGPQAVAGGDEIRVGRQLLRVETVTRSPRGASAKPWGSRDPGFGARLVQILEGGRAGDVFPLTSGELSIGRDAGDVSFPQDHYVSARHARIVVGEGKIVLSDVGSSNGTFVRLTAPTAVTAGDQLLVGMQMLRLDG
jgi:pSer/pThr/pTyr-binding forkhead associated (FHA) protein